MLKKSESDTNAGRWRNRIIDGTGGAPDYWRDSVDESSINRRRIAGTAPVLAVGNGFDLSAFVPPIPWWFTWLVLPFLMLAGLWWAIRERSVSGAADRGKRNVRRSVVASGIVGASVVGGILGGLEASQQVVLLLGDVLVPHLQILANFAALSGIWTVLNRATDLGTYEIMLILGVVFFVVLKLQEDK